MPALRRRRNGCALRADRVWEDDLWRLSLSGRGYVRGFGYLEPKRHVPHISDLDGDEAATFGPPCVRDQRSAIPRLTV